MPLNIPRRLEIAQGNVYPAMLDCLGRQLGVSADSLARLGLGWAPAITFKPRGREAYKNWDGWWMIPERDARGDIVGLGLRKHKDGRAKTMYPGTKHGLIYEVNPQHETGITTNPGSWVRTMDAGVLCPVCHKPDGCLVNSETLDDPNGDAVCIRVIDGSVRPMGMGYLHSKHTHSRAATVLPPNQDWTIIVEGMSDAAAAMDLGFQAVGRPSNLAGMDMLCDLVRGRRVAVIGENDDINPLTGKRPGHEGAVATFQMVRRVCPYATRILPPEQFKDLRRWKVDGGLTHDSLLAYIEEHGETHTEILVLPDLRPKTAAVQYLDDQHRMAGRYLLKHWNESWYAYTGSCYREVPSTVFEQPIYAWAHDKKFQVSDGSGQGAIKDVVCDISFINNITRAIRAETLVPELAAPCWINGVMGPRPEDLIAFSNGLLHLPSYLAGKDETEYLLPSTPDFFTTAALPFPFDPTALCRRWDRMMTETFEHDPMCELLLQEWFGYCMTTDISMQKLMYLRGPSGAGKGVIMHILSNLVGSQQSVSTTLAKLTSNFGIADLRDKMVCLIPDARDSKKVDMMQALELLLMIAGGDDIAVRRLYRESEESRPLPCRITIGSNYFIELPDTEGASVRRLNVIQFEKTFKDNPDNALQSKLRQETPGIAIWALEGLRRLREQGYFTVPPTSKEALDEWRCSISPMASFLEECTTADPDGEVLKQELEDAWRKWAIERGLKVGRTSRFYEQIRSNAPHAVSQTTDQGTTKRRVYRGLKLQQWAARQYLGRPS